MAKLKILVVEDSKISARLIQKSLERLGHAVSALVASGEEAIKKAEEDKHDLVLMDIVLEGEMDGIEAAEIMRTRFDIPVIYISSNTEKKTLERVKKTEPFGFITKPFEDMGIESNIEIALYKHKMEKKLKESMEKLRSMSVTDELTGLHNRRGFFTLAEQQMKIADRKKKEICLLYADLDDLKQINDTLGHKEGDKALIETAKILKETFREADVISRLGGDEFAVIVIESSEFSNEVIISNRLQKNVDTYNAKANRRYTLAISTGIVRYNPEKPCSIDELLARADAFMYENKQNQQP